MSKKIILFVSILLGIISQIGAQTASPSVIPSTGGSATNGNVQMQFTIGEPLIPTLIASTRKLSLGFEQPEMNITDSIGSGPYCAGSTVNVFYKAKGIYSPNNVFTVFLSDSSGDFAEASTIGKDTSMVSGTISAVLPFNIPSGSHYRVRVMSDQHELFDGFSSSFLVYSVAEPIGITAQSICADTGDHYTFSDITVGHGGNQIEWAIDSNFSSPHFIASNSSVTLHLSPGSDSSIWVRSVDSLKGCVSNSLLYKVNKPVALYPKDSLVLMDSSTIIVVPIGRTGVLYILKVDTTTITSVFGTADTLLLPTGPIDTTSVFNVWAIDTALGCTRKIADSIIVKPYLDGKIIEQTFNTLMQDTDPNYFLVVDSIDNMIRILEHAEASGIEVIMQEDFVESYEEWRQFWKNKASANNGNPGSFKPSLKSLKSLLGSTINPSTTCNPFDPMPAWTLEGPDVDPLCSSCSGEPGADGRQQNNAQVNQIWVNPTNTNDMIAAVGNSGLWQFDQTMGRWSNISQGSNGISPLLNYNVVSFAVNPNNRQNIFASSELGFNGNTPQINGKSPVFSIGVFFTTDGGSTWQFDSQLDDLITTQFNTTDKNWAYGATDPKVRKLFFVGNILFALGFNHVYRKDLGNPTDVWQDISDLKAENLFPGDPRSFYYDNLTYDSRNPENIFIGSSEEDRYPSLFGRLYFSNDAGVHFSKIDYSLFLDAANDPIMNCLSAKTYIPSSGHKIYAFMGGVSPNTTNPVTPPYNPTVWAISIYETDLDQFYLNNTIQWTLKGSGNLTQGNAVRIPGIDFIVSNSQSSVNSPNPIIYLAEDYIRYTDDFGQTFKYAFGCERDQNALLPFSNCNRHTDERNTILLPYPDPTSVAADGLDDVLYYGTDGGVSAHLAGTCTVNDASSNANSCFTNLNKKGLYGQSITSIDFDPIDPGYLTYSAIHHTITKKESGDWHIIGDGDTYKVNVIDIGTPSSPNRYTMFSNGGGGNSGGLGYVPPGSEDVNNINITTPQNGSVLSRPTQVHPDGFIYLGEQNLLRSAIGSTFSFDISCSACTGLGTGSYTSFFNTTSPICALSVNETDDQIIYLGFSTGNAVQLARSINGGDNWTDLTSLLTTDGTKPFDFYCLTDVESDPNDVSKAWVSFSGYPVDATGTARERADRVWRTIDGGDHWCDASDGLPPVPINKLIIFKYGTDVVFAATDIGVYVFQSDGTHTCPGGSWVCVDNGLPPVTVSDLKIDYCSMKLYAGLYNWGIWSWVIPDELITGAPATIAINGTSTLGGSAVSGVVTWDASMDLLNSIDIETGYTLHIDNSAVISMGRNTTITVERGAKLMVDGTAKLTNGCGSTWGGIVVKGDKLLIQNLANEGDNTIATCSNQGFVYLNGATIENSQNGIQVWNTADGWVNTSPNTITGGTGGIVRAVGSYFTNNRVATAFNYYHSFSGSIENANKSYFTNCTFKTDDSYNQPSPFYAFITNWSTYGISIKNCNFENDETNLTSAHQLGSGILSIDAGYMVQGGSFTNLYNGILVENQSNTSAVKVYDATFTDNQIGINLSNSSHSNVNGNTFTIGHLANVNPTGNFIGVGFDQSTQFAHTLNTFNSNNGIDGNERAIGSAFINTSFSNMAETQSLANNYTNISFASLANLINRSTGGFAGQHGLQFLCNVNNNAPEQYDFTVYQDFINDDDGIRDNQGDQINGMSNTFSAPSTIVKNQFYNLAHNTIVYHWHLSTEKPSPSDIQGVNVPNFASQQDPTCSTSGSGCLICLISPSQNTTEKADFDTEYGAYSSYSNTWLSMIDGGNTANLLSLVTSATIGNADSLRLVLNSISPYLSNVVLQALINKTSIYPVDTIYNILYANPDALGAANLLINAKKILPLSDSLVDSLTGHMEDTTTRTTLESNVAYHSSQYHALSRDIIGYMLNDSTGFDHVDYRFWLSKLHDVEADYMRIEDYWETGNIDSAMSMLDSITVWYSLSPIQDSSYQTFRIYMEFEKTLSDDSVSIQHLDSTQLASFDSIAQNGKGIGARKAQGALHYFYGYPYATQYQIPSDGGGRMLSYYRTDSTTNTAAPTAYLTAFPNPTNGVETFQFLLPCPKAEGWLIVADITGRTLSTAIVNSDMTQTSVDTKQWQNGVYLYRLTCNDKIVGAGIFEVEK